MRNLRLSLIRVLLVLTSLAPLGMASPASVGDSLSKWHSGQRMRVTLASGGTLMGNLGEVHAGSFVLLPDSHAGLSRDLRFDEVKSVEKKWKRTTKWIVGLGIFLGLVGLGALV